MHVLYILRGNLNVFDSSKATPLAPRQWKREPPPRFLRRLNCLAFQRKGPFQTRAWLRRSLSFSLEVGHELIELPAGTYNGCLQLSEPIYG